MRKKCVAIIITAICLAGCGNKPAVSNDVSNPVSDVSKTAESVLDISEITEAATDVSKPAEAEAKSDEESVDDEKAALYDKYADICDCLESKDYDKAIEIIEAMRQTVKSEPLTETETIPLTLDNWDTYFTLDHEIEVGEGRDAYGNILESYYKVHLVLKPEYKEKLVSMTGEMGYECDNVTHVVTNIDKATGLFDTEIIESGPANGEVLAREHSSTTITLDNSEGTWLIAVARAGNDYSYGGIDVKILAADDIGNQYLYYPEELNVVRINGELVLRK